MRSSRSVQGFILSLVVSSALWAANNGDIVGVVRDQSGAFLPGVTVTVVNDSTGARRSVVTNETGEFAATLLPPASYTITAELPGFKKDIRTGVVLHVDDKLRLEFTLSVGDITESITVNEAVPLVQTDTATLGAVIDTRKVLDLPLNGRSFLQLNLLAPGVSPPAQGSTLATQGGSISVNGAREASNNYLLDGIDNNNLGIGIFVIPISVEAVQEFKVHTGLSSVEFGRSAGAQINVATKSGGNEFHGSFFEFIRNSALDAKNFFDSPTAPIPPFKRNQFGGTFGGPILIPRVYDGHNRSFFFLSYEGTRIRDSITRRATVPLPALLQGDFSSQAARIRDPLTGQPFPNNVIPADRIDPIARGLGAYFPAPNVPGATAANFTSSPKTRNNLYQYNVRIDHRLGDRDILFGRYSRWEENRFNPFDPLANPTNLPGFGSRTLNTGHNLALNYTRVFSSSLTNELRAGFNRLIAPIIQENQGNDIGGRLGITGTSRKPIDFGFPCVQISGFDSLCEATNIYQTRVENTFHYVETLGYTRGSHSLKIGGDIRRFQRYAVRNQQARGSFTFNGQYSGTSLSDFLLGFPSQTIRGLGEPFNNGRFISSSLFFGDDYKLSDRLTLNYGLRWEYNSPPIDVSKPISRLTNFRFSEGRFFGPGTGDSSSPRVWNRDLNNFAPRFGVAYRPFGADTVVRLGYGVFFDQASVAGLSDYRFNPPFFGQETNIASTTAPNLTLRNGFQPVQTIGQGVVAANGVHEDLKDAYVQQWSMNIQHSFSRNFVFETAYVGTKGSHLVRARDLNRPVLGLGAAQDRRPNPRYSGVTINESSAASSYHSLQLRAEQRFSRGLTFLGSYTFAKSIDDVGGAAAGGATQDVRNLRAEKGLSNYDVRQRFTISYIYELPFGKDKAFLNDLPRGLGFFLADWQFGGIGVLQSGAPLTPNLSIDNSRTGAASSDRPNLVGNPKLDKPGPDQFFNPAAFQTPPVNTFGNAGRDILIGPDYKSFDFTLSKKFPFGEDNHVLFRAEAFNAFNHPNFDLPNRFTNTTSFGKIFSAKSPRQIQFALKIVY